MSWAQWHQTSERLASEAEVLYRRNDIDAARLLYAQAADAEHKALQSLEPSKVRTRAITAVSVVSLWFKAAKFAESEQLAYTLLGAGDLPDFAVHELRTLVQAIWTEGSKQTAGVTFLPGQVFVAVKGGEVITGGAPLDLIVNKVQTIQAMFYRTIEEAQAMPLRIRGGPVREVQEACRPWLFQAPPGSYQFSVAIQEPAQRDFFKDRLDPNRIAERFLAILRATTSDDPRNLEAIVPDEGYRGTFLKLARNLAPTGKTFDTLEVRSATDSSPVELSPESRRSIVSTLRSKEKLSPPAPEQTEITFNGILRAVDLNRDWLDISVDGVPQHVLGLKDTLDDVIGPMVNKRVIVRALKGGKAGLELQDIEFDE